MRRCELENRWYAYDDDDDDVVIHEDRLASADSPMKAPAHPFAHVCELQTHCSYPALFIA